MVDSFRVVSVRLTHTTEKEKELGGVLIEAKVDGLGVENGAYQVAFSREESYRRRRILKWLLTVI